MCLCLFVRSLVRFLSLTLLLVSELSVSAHTLTRTHAHTCMHASMCLCLLVRSLVRFFSLAHLLVSELSVSAHALTCTLTHMHVCIDVCSSARLLIRFSLSRSLTCE
jgi:hypothetical protein